MSRLHDQAGETRPKVIGTIPIQCAKCRGYGFTGCDEAINPSGVFIAIAFEKGVACSCPSGVEFGNFQMEWMK